MYVVQITYTGTGDPYLQKIAKDGKSEFAVGEKLHRGTMVSVGMQLYMFVPEGGGITSIERQLTGVNTRWWGECTSEVVALLLDGKRALVCLDAQDLVSCDPRWLEGTIEVLRAIGDSHPHCSISLHPDFWLLPPEQWR
ncbi:hypothetical protein KW786_00100 [Candidatus Parcubacteria bacterium]|nr:hypothetical protein [Candidatus Parcubacteria bacterium]